jgi:hypothetical protein
MPSPAGLSSRILDPLGFEALMKVFEDLGALCAEHKAPCPELVMDCGCEFCTVKDDSLYVQSSSKLIENDAAGGSGGRGRRGKSPISMTEQGAPGGSGGGDSGMRGKSPVSRTHHKRRASSAAVAPSRVKRQLGVVNPWGMDDDQAMQAALAASLDVGGGVIDMTMDDSC